MSIYIYIYIHILRKIFVGRHLVHLSAGVYPTWKDVKAPPRRASTSGHHVSPVPKWIASLHQSTMWFNYPETMPRFLSSLEGIQGRWLPSSKRTVRASWYLRLRPWSLTRRRDNHSCIDESFAGPTTEKNWDSCRKSRLFGLSNLSDLFPRPQGY